ncbi:MAG TPA: hypothetical protein VMD97_04470 [Candidatus Aquilonibacter sp.]|nr:hypothetical protein [Candidatus Aquilonibacter sp.]
MATTNEVLSANTNKLFTALRTVKDDESDWTGQFILIEGNADTFRFLGSLFNSMAEYKEDCSLALHPEAAGLNHFARGSEVGLMLHRDDCAYGDKR